MPRPEVFLSHASADKESVKAIAIQLQQHAVPTWLDEWNLIPGEPWLDALGHALKECSGCVVFLGPGGEAPWHHEEVRSALDRAVRDRSFRVIPVLLPGTRRERLSHLPEFLANRQWVEFTKGLDDADAIHRLVCGIRGIEPGPRAGVAYAPGRNPYRGLRVFDVDDAPLFFGREVLTQELLDKLGPGNRFVGIVGPSGSGKSSLARAGLLASLGAGRLPGSAGWPQIVIRPGAFPLESLAIGIAGTLAPAVDPAELIRRLGAGEEALHREVRLALREHPERRAVLLVDQAEEVFTLATRDTDRAAFLANVVYAATVRTGQTMVVLAFRADFYSRFAEHRQLAALVSDNHLLVPPMSEDELRRAIALPAERAGRPLRPALVDEVLADSRGRPGSLPLVEHALAQLWERPEPVLGIEEYRSVGGVAGALNNRAEAIFGALTTAQQATCRRLFLRLAQQGDHALDTRRRVRRTELPDDQQEVSQAFAAEGVHLLVSSQEGDYEVLEVAHEELIRRWSRLHQWLGEDRSGQRIHRRLMAATAEWNARAPESRDESFLYRGAALAEVEEWLARLPEEERRDLLNANEVAFLEQGRSTRDRARLEQEQRVRDTEELALKITTLQAAQSVVLSRELTAFVGASIDKDPQLNLALLKQAHRLAETEELFPVLAQWSNALGRAELRGHSSPVQTAAFSPDGSRIVTASTDNTARLWEAASGKHLAALSRHSDSVCNAAFSPNGLRVITTSRDRTARLWDAFSGKHLAALSGHSDSVCNAAFSPNGLRVVTASRDGTARLWDASSSKHLATLSGHSAAVLSAAFSPDGLRIITAGDDNTARLWDAYSGKHLAALSGHSAAVLNAAFSPDSSCIVTASRDRTARLWDASSGKHLAILSGHSAAVLSAVFSPDSSCIVTASHDNTARLWNAAFGKHLDTLSGHSGSVLTAAFSPDGLRVVTASDDHTARLWEVDSGKHLVTLSGHSAAVWTAAFSPDGLRVVTTSDDHTARLWDADPGKPFVTLSGHSGSVLDAAFSPNGLRILTASSDRATRLWDVSSGKHLTTLSGHSGAVLSAAFSLDGLRILTASSDNTARLWDASSGKHLAILSGHLGAVLGAAFSPNGLRVVTASYDRKARLWDASSGKHLATLSGHSAAVWSAEFSPDGLRILTASHDNTARLWDAASGKLLDALSGHSRPVRSAAFSPNGLQILTASHDNTARLWDAASGKLLAVLSGHSDEVRSAAFSPDGLRIVTTSHDKTARLWDTASGKHLATLSGHSAAVLNAAFGPDGLRIVTASHDKTARLWDAASGKHLATLSGHHNWLRCAAFSPDGLRIVTASHDKTALVWQNLLWAPRSKQLEVLDSGRELTPEERRTYLHE